MQRANLTLKAASLAALAALSFGVGAQIVAPAAPLANEVGLPPAVAASAPATPRAPSAADVQAVVIGKGDAGTLKELEALQRETAIADMRKKLADLKPATVAAPAVAAVPPAVTTIPPVDPAAAAPVGKKRGKKAEVAAAPPVKIKPVEYVEPPKTKLVNLLVMGGRARADVMEGGRMFTVKEGDKLGRWTVASINSAGVTVERRYMEQSLAPLAPMPSPERRPSIAEAFGAAYSLVNSAYPQIVETEKVETKVLESASPADVAVGIASVATSGPAASNAAATLPPLPKPVDKPDSTSMTAVPPLPPALGSSTSSLSALPTGAIPMPTQLNAAAK